MSLLSEEQSQDLARFLESGNAADDSSESQIEAQEITTEEIDVKQDQESSPEPQNEESGHSVPYSRFKSVIESRNDLRQKTSDLEEQLSTLESRFSQQENANQRTEAKSAIDQYLDDDIYYDEADEVQDRADVYESRIHELEVSHQEVQLQKEIDYATSKYPDVSEDVLLQAVINDPSIDVADVAERYSTFISGLKEEAIAEYSQRVPVAEVPPSVPPRVGSAASSNAGRAALGPESTPKTMDAAKGAFFNYLKANWNQ
jgi:ubiquinone biosynthesis protein UbiJ